MRTSVPAPRAVSSLALLLLLLLTVGLVVPVAGPAGAAAPRGLPWEAPCRAEAPYFIEGSLPARILMAAGNGSAGRTLTTSAAYAPGGPDSYPSEDVSAARPTLTRARLEAIEHRGLRASYFSGWHAQLRKQTRRLVARVKACPGEAEVLIGYSQGALVVRATLRSLTRTAKGRDVLDRIAGVVLIGDPAADRREKITRYGGAKASGVLRTRIPLPRRLVARGLVTSVCTADDPVCSSTAKSRRGRPTTAAGRRLVRSHLAYDLGLERRDVDTAAERAVVAMSRQLVRRYAAGPRWPHACFPTSNIPPTPCYVRREGDTFSAPATGTSGFRLSRAATTLPGGVQLASDWTLTGVAPDLDHDDLVVGYTSATVAPAVVRRAHLSLGSWPRQTARPGVRRISHALTGGPANGASSQPDVSADGEHVAFVSRASDLVAGDTNGAAPDIFVWDRATDTTKRLAVGDEAVAWPDVSADGRFVEFATKAQLAGDTDALSDVFVWDTQTDTVQLASPGTVVPASTGSIAPDGTTVFFREDPTGTAELGNVVRRWDRGTQLVETVTAPAGTSWMVDAENGRPWVASSDGRFVVTLSATRAALWDRVGDAQRGLGCAAQSDLRSGYGGAVASGGDVFVSTGFRDGRDPASWPVVCTTATGDGVVPYPDRPTGFSSDGRLEVDRWTSSNYSWPEVHDRATGVRTRPVGDATQPGDHVRGVASSTDDVSTVVFASTVKNIVETDPASYGRSEIYLWDRTVSP